MARITGSHLICRALQLEGVKNTFGLAGGLFHHRFLVLTASASEKF